MLDADLHSRLDEWARWARAYGRHRGRCRSIEHRWCSPQKDHWSEQAPPPRLPPVCIDRAMEVERAVTGIGDPWRCVLIVFYVHALPLQRIRRIVRRFGLHEPQRLLDEARQRVGDALTRGVQPRARASSYLREPATQSGHAR